MVLILAYQAFYYMPRMRKYEEAQRAKRAQEQLNAPASRDSLGQGLPADTLQAARDSTSAPTGAGSLDEGFPVVQPGQGRLIKVRTPLYEIVIAATSGAEIVSARLTRFETGGTPVELIAQGEIPNTGGMAGVTFVGDERTFSFSGVAFEAFADGATSPLDDGATVVVEAASPGETVTFRASGSDGRLVERYYRFTPDSYVVQSGVRFATAPFPFVRTVRWGLGAGLRPTEANAAEDLTALRASLRLGDEYYRLKRGTFDEKHSGMVYWVALQVKYFTAALMTLSPVGGEARLEGRKTDGFMTASFDLPVSERQGRVDQTVELYLGPIDFDALKAMGRGLEKNVEMGHKYFRPVSWAVLWSLLKLHTIIPNYGVVIILISVFTKILFYRLTHKSFKSMREMQALQPKLQALKNKYKEDRQKLSQETMKLYKEAGVNPLGGCLPMVLQMPVFIALFNVLRNTIELRQAPFVGWINDLSQQDVLYRLPATLPFLGDAVSVLPILMGVGMLVQSKIGGSITGSESTATQPKMLQYMLPVVFTVLFYRMPSGLVIYWLVNTVLSVAQQYYINKGAEKAEREKANENAKKTGRSS
jgi:YidC/Oxa1 family membrane protein insertase